MLDRRSIEARFFLEGLILSAGKLVPKPGHLYSLNQINFSLLDRLSVGPTRFKSFSSFLYLKV